ncbi:MAG: hypothetical protein LUD74_03175, partial [Tannerellaceae bacterium]|nr:hypothetical protein [Tannerellaceae bacterium]
MGLERREKQGNLYARLQKESITLLQQLCGEQWSDFNAHDPGITLAEITNYALYELDHQLNLPFEAYIQLTGNALSGLPDADTLSVPTLTTPADYEQLIFIQADQVSRCKVTYTPEGYYRIMLTVIPGTDHELIKTQISCLYHANRNLCEMLDQIEITGEAPRPILSPAHPGITFEPSGESSPYPTLTAGFYRLRNHLPGCYRINNKHQKQLDAYLLIFDHLLATTKQQAREAYTLFDLSIQEPFSSLPEIDEGDTPGLIEQEKRENSRLIPDTFSYHQRSRYLDLLDTLHAENSRKYYENKEIPLRNQLRASLLTRYPVMNQQRFRSFNLLNSLEHGAGAREMISRLAGFHTGS